MSISAAAAAAQNQPCILLVEDDPALATLVADRLRARHYRLVCAADRMEVERAIAQERPDLVILDIMLPDANGLLLCAELKAELQVPIILCSGTRRREDSLLGFKLGADDFVAKPFSMDELEARVEVALRRGGPRSGEPQAASRSFQDVGALVIDHATCRASVDDQPLELTRTEFRLLSTLADRPGEVLSHPALTDAVWGYDDPAVRRSLEVHIRRLRAKLRSGGAHAPQLLTQRGFGYRLLAEAAPRA